jgi:2-oxoisovalerate dehydrogenase E1 component
MAEQGLAEPRARTEAPDPSFDWRRVAYLVQVSRAMDRLEEERLVPERKVLYQFSARGHDMAQILLGSRLTHRRDATCGYYRSRPLLLSLGVPIEDALASGMGGKAAIRTAATSAWCSTTRTRTARRRLPMSGGVGAQYTPTAGWAQAIEYYRNVLGDRAYDEAIAVVLGGDASCATGGFWASLDHRHDAEAADALLRRGQSIRHLGPLHLPDARRRHLEEPRQLHRPRHLRRRRHRARRGRALVDRAVAHVRARKGPALLHLRVPRLQGHSFQDTQTYKSEEVVREEWLRDPLPKLKSFLVGSAFDEAEWDRIEADAQAAVEDARAKAEARGVSDPAEVLDHVFYEGEMQKMGGQWTKGYRAPPATRSRSRKGSGSTW